MGISSDSGAVPIQRSQVTSTPPTKSSCLSFFGWPEAWIVLILCGAFMKLLTSLAIQTLLVNNAALVPPDHQVLSQFWQDKMWAFGVADILWRASLSMMMTTTSSSTSHW